MHIVDYLLHLTRFMMLREDFCLNTGFRFGKVSLDPKEDHSEFPFHKLTTSAIEMNELWWRSSLDFFKRVTPSTPVLRSATKGISNSKSVHTRVRTEVREEVHVRNEVRRFVDKEEVRTRVVDEEDVQEKIILAKTVKEQEQMIADLQRRLYSVEQITKQLHTGPYDVDLLDKNDNHSHNVLGGLDHQSMEGVNQYMNDDQVDKYQSVEGVSQCTSVDHVDKRFNDEYDSIAVDGLNSLKSQDVEHISKKSFVMDDPDSTQRTMKKDVGVSESMDVDQPSLDTVMKDVKTVVVPFQRQKYPSKAAYPLIFHRRQLKLNARKGAVFGYVFFIVIFNGSNYSGSYAFPKCTEKTISVHEGVMSLFRDKKRMDMQWNFPWLEDGHLIRMDFWEKLVGRSHTKRGWLSDD
ncbi:hypothetical protein Tco_0676687, partial [Tanacetum coccineum]